MRTGATQQSTSANPLVTVTIGADVYKSEGGGGDERILRVRTDEQAWGGEYIIELDNSDEALNAKNYEGEVLTLNLTFIGSSSDNLPPLWVMFQEDISAEGELKIVLHCGDVWALIASHNVTLVNASFNQQWQTVDGLAGRKMPDGSLITDAKWSSLYNDLVARGDKTVWGVIQYLDTATGVTITKTDTDSYLDTLKPPVNIGNARTGLRQLMDYTASYLRLTAGGGLETIHPSSHASVYTYDDLDVPFLDTEAIGVAIPNRINIWAFNEAGDAWHYGEAIDTTSYGKLGQYIYRHYLVATLDNGNLKSEADLDALAAGILAKINAELSQGTLIAPMHCTQELFDKITVIDDRYTTPRTITGYVNRIVREYDRGVYRITIQLGGVTSGWTPPSGEDVEGLADGEPPKAPFPSWDLPPWDDILPKAIQGYQHDITFSSTDWDTVAWTAGTIKFYDGTTQAILAGNTGNLGTDSIYYIYFDLDDASPNVLKVVTDYMSVMDEKTGMICLIQRGSSSAILATIIPSYGKEPLITPDVIYMAGIKEWTDPVTGGHYSAILANQLDAGHISLSSETTFAAGYNPSEKRKTFVVTPTTPYYVGDVWVNDEEVRHCITQRLTGAYVAADWSLDYKRIATTNISSGRLYLSTVYESSGANYVSNTEKSLWNTVEDKGLTTVFRQAGTPSGAKAGDVWIHTDDVAGDDKPYTYNGSSWIASFTAIDGGHIITGTIDCSVVTIQTAGSGDKVILNSAGIKIVGSTSPLKVYYNDATYAGYIKCTSSALQLWSTSAYDLDIHSGEILRLIADAGIFISGDFVSLLGSVYLVLPQATSQPSSGTEGEMIWSSDNGQLNCYHNGAWRHPGMDAGWL